MSHDHEHDLSHVNESKLRWALLLTGSFLIAEVIGAWLTGSLALLSDAAHMLTDVVGLMIAIMGIRLARRPADKYRTFGYHRIEILAALTNGVMLFGIALYIVIETIARIRAPVEVASGLMFWVACGGLLVNIICMRILAGGHEDSLNIKGAYLEVWSDMISSIAVIAAAIIIYVTKWYWVDIVLALGIGMWMLPRTWRLMKQSVHILLEGVPESVNIEQIEQALTQVAGVHAIHDLHVWEIASNKISLTAHAIVDLREHAYDNVLSDLLLVLQTEFNIDHATIQIEPYDSPIAQHGHDFGVAHFGSPSPTAHQDY